MNSLESTLASIAKRHTTSLFRTLPQRSITTEWLHRFDANFRLRTLLTIPEVFCTGIAVANYLHFEGIAASGSIVADETGVCRDTLQPDSTAVHSVLLNRAFDSLRQTAFNLPSLGIRELFGLVRVLDRLLTIGGEPESAGERWILVRVDLELYDHFHVPTHFSPLAAKLLQQSVTEALTSHGVTEATMNYCHSQFRMQRCDNPARVIGRALMHEYMADRMLSDIEALLFLPHRSLWDDLAYESEVAPYFLAHRNDTQSKYVELEHAERMRAIAAPFLQSPLMREPLLEEAARFALEQERLFNSLIANPLEALAPLSSASL